MKIIDREGELDLEEFMQRPLFAHLATFDGEKPCESPVWFLWEDDCIWIIGSSTSDTFPKRIEKFHKCSIGITDLDTKSGKVHHVGFRGVGELTSWDLDRAKRKLRKYLGEDESKWDRDRFTLKAEQKNLLLVKITPETCVIRDQSFKVEK